MWELDSVVLEKTSESPLDCKDIKPVNHKRNLSPEYSLEGLMIKLKLQYFGYLMQSADSLETDAGKDWRQEEKGMTGDEMVGWHHQFNGHEFAQAMEVGDGQGSLACYSL